MKPAGRARGRARGRPAADAQRPGGAPPAQQQVQQPPPQRAVGGGVPQGAVGAPTPVPQGVQGAVGGAPPAQVPGSGRASYRGNHKKPGANNGQGPKPPVDELSHLSLGTKAVSDVERAQREQQPRNPYANPDYKPAHIVQKRGAMGAEMPLTGNFFKFTYDDDWSLYQYHVDFLPPKENRKLKVGLLGSHSALLGDVRAFDGTILYLPFALENEETVVNSYVRHDNSQVKITIKLTCRIPPRTTQTLQVMNIIWKKILRLVGMTQINRHYFDLKRAIQVPQQGLEVIPGFQTSILQYEQDVLLEIDIAHKILRTNSVLDLLYELYRKAGKNFYTQACKEVVGTIIMTRYNNKTYRVDDIDWDKRTTDTFDLADGNKKTFVDYYFTQYEVEIKDLNQPLLVSKPKKRDIRRGQTGLIYLVPELCTLTGLSEEARSDFGLMKDVAVHTRIGPDGRVKRLLSFMKSLTQNPEVTKELQKWNLGFEKQLTKIRARQFPREVIVMKDRNERDVQLDYRQDEADWSRDMRGKRMRMAVSMKNWIIVFTQPSMRNADDLAKTLAQVGPPMGMGISQPDMVKIESDRNETYLSALRSRINPDVQMAVCILPNNKKDRYDSIKKFCCIDCPVPSQMVLARTLNKQKQLMSVATKIAIQMNCKMGGVVWSVPIPLKGTMIVGIDTYHDSSAKGRSCGGVVATTNGDFTRYYSTVTFQMTHQELQDNLTVSLSACLRAFEKEQKALPEKVIVYRDGVGDGQLDVVFGHEVPQVQDALKRAGGEMYTPKMAYVVVKKRINARFFAQGQNAPPRGGMGDARPGPVNPPPGTIIDDTVTKHNWYDFFLISQSVRQGTVGPTHYNILHDMTGLAPDHFQRLSYKLTHMYFNWQGTIRVPAPCMYAHKLAFLSGQSLHRDFHPELADKLFFL